MPAFLYVGTSGMDFPSDDGVTPSFTVEPGDTVEADTNPHEAWFDLVDKPDGHATAGDVASTITETTADPTATPTEEP